MTCSKAALEPMRFEADDEIRDDATGSAGFIESSSPEAFDGDYHYVDGRTLGNNDEFTFTWVFENLDSLAAYDVFITWPELPDAARNVQFHVSGSNLNNDDGSYIIDQRIAPQGEISSDQLWQQLATVDLAEGGLNSITVTMTVDNSLRMIRGLLKETYSTTSTAMVFGTDRHSLWMQLILCSLSMFPHGLVVAPTFRGSVRFLMPRYPAFQL